MENENNDKDYAKIMEWEIRHISTPFILHCIGNHDCNSQFWI